MDNKPKIFKLRSENLSNLGGPMGTEYTYDNWSKYYTSVVAAKDAAEKDYGKSLKWFSEGRNKYRTDDLSYVMYHIEKVKVEE